MQISFQKFTSGKQAEREPDDLGRLGLLGGLTVLGLFASLVLWASLMHVSSAAIATGQVTVEGSRKAIQHRDGGPVEAVLVREGDKVKKGQPLLKLDLTEDEGQEQVLEGLRIQYLARVARLEAEIADAEAVTFPDELVKAKDTDPRVHTFVTQESAVFDAKRNAYFGKKSLLEQQISSGREKVSALEGSLRATQKQLQLVKAESDALQPLVEKGLIARPRILSLNTGAAELESAIEKTNALLTEERSAIEEAAISIEQLKRDRLEQASTELSVSRASLAEVEPRLHSIRDRIRRGTLVSPVNGYVFNLSVFGQGAALVPGQTVMEIVPADDDLVLTVQIPLNDIDDVRVGQNVVVHLLAYSQRYQFQINGTLVSISSDEMLDEIMQFKYFEGKVEVDGEDLANSGATLVPGMSVQAMIQTGSRTIMAYLLDPLTRLQEFAFKES